MTTIVNFNILIITPHRTIGKTYLDLLYEYVTMSQSRRWSDVRDVIETHPRIQQMKEWVVRNREYNRVTEKTIISHHPYSNIYRGGEQGEFLTLRDDFVSDYRKQERMKQYIDGGLQISVPIEQRVNDVTKESVFKKMMNLLKLKSR